MSIIAHCLRHQTPSPSQSHPALAYTHQTPKCNSKAMLGAIPQGAHPREHARASCSISKAHVEMKKRSPFWKFAMQGQN